MLSRPLVHLIALVAVCLTVTGPALAQSITVSGTVRDETGGVLRGVSVVLRPRDLPPREVTTDADGRYRFDLVPAGEAQLTFTLVNFGVVRRNIVVALGGGSADAVLRLSLSAEVVVTGKRTFTNLADAANPAEDLVGIAQAASQGAITAAQLESRPMSRPGDVMETIPGVIISQHSGEGKANQYYLRGFNLDHGTDIATTVAGMPVNMPTHGHGHGYADLNFLIPELVSGVQYSKGPYYADLGDFATAGAANINYVNSLDHSISKVAGGEDGFARVLAAGSLKAASGVWLGAIELEHNDGPWETPDNFRKVNGLLRYTRGTALDGLSVTVMGYRGQWNATDQVPARAVEQGAIGRYGSVDPTDAGDSYRYSGSLEWQRTSGNRVTNVSAYGIGYDLNLFSNFTYFLDDPERGDQFHQADHRFVVGGRIGQRWMTNWAGRSVQNTIGAQVRNDNITKVGLYHTQARERLETVSEDRVIQTSLAGYVQNEIEWSPKLRSLAGLRVDGYRFDVDAGNPLNGGKESAGLASPKAGLTIGPFKGTEFYVNGGFGFHSNDARGATISLDSSTGEPLEPVTPLARARGAEAGVRSVAVPHLQSTLAVWTLSLDSELIFIGDAGRTEAGRPSHRWGVEFANYYSPRKWLTFDADLSWSHARFTDDDPAGDHIPGAINTVASAGVTMDGRSVVAGARIRYFGPRALMEDNSVRSQATTLVNLEAGYKFSPKVRLAVDVLNLFDNKDSDIDYFYTSRLPGESADGVADIHSHPTLPRTTRINLILAF